MKNLFYLFCLALLFIGCEKEIFEPQGRKAPVDVRPVDNRLIDQLDNGASVTSIDYDGHSLEEAIAALRQRLISDGLEPVDGSTLTGDSFDPTPRLDAAEDIDECQRCRESIEARRVEQQLASDRDCTDLFSIVPCCTNTARLEDALLLVVVTRSDC